MRVRVKLFAAARDLAGADIVDVELSSGASFGDLRTKLISTHPHLSPVGVRSIFAADARYVSDEESISETAEIALIPPVSGG